MKKPLLNVIFASEKRKNVLLMLQDGFKKMQFILEAHNTTRQTILPQIRILEEHHLVAQLDDSYELTTIGKLIVDEMKPLLETVKTFNMDIEYWGTRDLSFIPSHLFKRLRELNPYQIFKPSISEINHPNKDLIETTASSKKMFAVTNIFHPNFMKLFTLWAENNVEIHMIFSQEFFKKLLEHNRDEFQQLLDNENYHFYRYDKLFHSLYFAVNDHMTLLAILRTKGWFDEKSVTSYSNTARKWTNELFEYYLKDSTRITEL
ncbi:helix-turn-helix transcriptional regulator [Methanolobus halotolerans]|nr:winged helix-turn-helix domain-containing protein [Methanolobus halotolerans]